MRNNKNRIKTYILLVPLLLFSFIVVIFGFFHYQNTIIPHQYVDEIFGTSMKLYIKKSNNPDSKFIDPYNIYWGDGKGYQFFLWEWYDSVLDYNEISYTIVDNNVYMIITRSGGNTVSYDYPLIYKISKDKKVELLSDGLGEWAITCGHPKIIKNNIVYKTHKNTCELNFIFETKKVKLTELYQHKILINELKN